MVHGNYYGVQYEIYLNKELDLFNDILPICIDVRKMISLEKHSNQYKLVIIPYRELDERFEKREHVRKYMGSLDEISYDHRKTRKTHPDLFKYYDVKIYKNSLKYYKFPEPYTQEELKECEKCFDDLLDIYNSEDFWDKYSSDERNEFNKKQITLRETLNIQRIISNPEYFEEIKEIERELTDIELTEEEKELVQKVLSHPKLEGAIEFNGINLIDGYY